MSSPPGTDHPVERRPAIGTAFINFRVGDAQDSAVLIDEKLRRVFGDDHVFRSSRAIPKGSLFDQVILQAVADCSVLLAVIGPNWLAKNDKGNRRIDAPADWVRVEIEAAIAGGKPIIPILIGDLRMPKTDELPASIADLPRRQYIRLHHRSAEFDLLHIVDAVREHLGPPNGTEMPKGPDSALLSHLQELSRSADVRIGPADINNRLYSDSVIHRCRDFAQSSRGSISFNLRRNYRRFEATVGVLDDATEREQVGVFRILVDGRLVKEATAQHGDPRVLKVDVSDVLHLQLQSFRPGVIENPILAGVRMTGGLSNHLPELAWGNPMVHV
jgi:hypothetical protein